MPRARYAAEVMTQDFPFKRIGVVGTGRVAQAMALALGPRGAQPALIWGRSAARNVQAAVRVGGEVAELAEVVAGCDLIVIAVADDAIASVVETMARMSLGHAPFVFHVSGRSGAALLSPLETAGATVAAVHPAMTFTGDPVQEVERMAGARFAVTGLSGEAVADALAVVDALRGVAVEIAEAHRPLYHAALCHGANHLVTLITGAMDALSAAGVNEPAALLAPLVRATLDNTLTNGFAALSGPVLRGDGGTVAGHLDAIAAHAPDLLAPYRAMATETLAALERRGTAVNPDALRDILSSDQPR